MDLFEQVSEDIKNAMKAKDKVALETLRNIKKFFLEAKTAPGANDILTDDAALKIIQKLVKQGKDSAEIYIGQGRQDLADVELGQVAVMEKYLPKQMSAEELEAALKEIIAETGATSGKDMGKVRTCRRTCHFRKSKRAFGITSGTSTEPFSVRFYLASYTNQSLSI